MQPLDTDTHILLAYLIAFALIGVLIIGSWVKSRTTRNAIARIKHVGSHES